MMRRLMIPLLALSALPLMAASTQTWEMNTYDDFLKGKFEGVSLGREGVLTLAPALRNLFVSDQPAIWSVVRASDGALYLGTGHRGRVYRVDSSGKGDVVWTADEPEVFALALDRRGRLYAATSPRGKVYRIEDGQAAEFFSPGATYVWSLAFDEEGSLFVGTGDDGRIHKVDASGRGEVYYETGQSHVTCLAFDAAGRLLAGTEPNGILYRVSEKNKAFVLYDANLPEIRSLAPMPDGSVYAAALGGSVARKAAAAGIAGAKPPLVTAAPTSITVTAAQGGVQIQPSAEGAAQAGQGAAALPPALPVIEISGVEKSALYKIAPNHFVETLWSSTEENAYDLLPAGDKIIFSTDKNGRLYELDAGRRVTLLAETNESEAVRLLRDPGGLLVATGNMGRLFRLGDELATEGAYEAPVHDAARAAQWGKLSWDASVPEGGEISFETRSGNSARPDQTWSDWSPPMKDARGSQIASPNARFIQWRAKLRGAGSPAPALSSVRLAYLPQNAAPQITGIAISNKASTTTDSTAAATAARSSSTSAYSITVTDTGESGASTVSGTSTQNLRRSASDEIQVVWHAEDLDGDKLLYSLYFRGEGEREWKVLKERLEETSYTIDSDVLADGKYLFRVQVSDSPANPPGAARATDYVSAPVFVDHTPPTLEVSEPARDGDRVVVAVRVRDAASPLTRCEYSLDAGSWIPVSADDGIIDSPAESFRIVLESLADGEHLLVVRAYDSAGNAGLTKIILRQ